MRSFKLNRTVDATGVSGTGIVAEGVEFSNGKCSLSWLTSVTSVAVYDDIESVRKIHGHDGQTVVEWAEAANLEIAARAVYAHTHPLMTFSALGPNEMADLIGTTRVCLEAAGVCIAGGGLGIKVVVDPALPDDTVEIRGDPRGVVARLRVVPE